MNLSRAVFDTNVLISAFLTPGRTAHKALNICFDENIDLLFNSETMDELITRLSKPKFKKYSHNKSLEIYLSGLNEVATWVSGHHLVEACRDADDNKFLEVGILGQADVLVSGDKDLLVLDPFQDIRIMTPRSFCDLWA